MTNNAVGSIFPNIDTSSLPTNDSVLENNQVGYLRPVIPQYSTYQMPQTNIIPNPQINQIPADSIPRPNIYNSGQYQQPYQNRMPQQTQQAQQVHKQMPQNRNQEIFMRSIYPEALNIFMSQVMSHQQPVYPPWIDQATKMYWHKLANERLAYMYNQKSMRPPAPALQPIKTDHMVMKTKGRPKKKKDDEFPKPKANMTNFEDLPDDYVPMNLVERRSNSRNNRKTVNYSERYEGEEEEDEAPKQETGPRLDHIYLKREGPQYLVRFHDSPPAICKWVSEDEVRLASNWKAHLPKFLQEQPQTPEFTPVAHRREPLELLYKFAYDSMILFFWDKPTREYINIYVKNRTKVPIIDPPYPTGPLPAPSNDLLVSPEASLKPHQVEGVQWLVSCWMKHHGSILADEMGLGKTIQTLAFLSYISKYANWHGPFLIAVRTNCFRQWCEEIEKWTNLKYVAYSAGPSQRKVIREFMFPFLDDFGRPVRNELAFNILLVSYDVLLKDTEYLSQIPWQVLVVDEGHRIKNAQGKKNNAMSALRAKHRIILTGTPIQNTLGELWALLKFVSPNLFSRPPSFLEEDIESITQEQLEQLQKAIHGQILRRTLTDTDLKLAPKDERVAFVSLAPAQEDIIRLISLHSSWRLTGRKTGDAGIDTGREARDILKACSHPFLVDGAEEYFVAKSTQTRLELMLNTSSKLQWLDNVLRCLYADKRKVLIFSQRVKTLKLLKEYCNLRGYASEMLVGSMGDIEKRASIERFSLVDSPSFVFLISTRAGAEGLNLTIADVTIIFDPDWNPQNDLQAQGRCYRIGQTRKVDVIRLIAHGTYEHEMFVRAQKKLYLWLKVIGGGGSTFGGGDSVPSPPLCIPYESYDLEHLLDATSSVARTLDLEELPKIHIPTEDEEEFLAKFPIEEEDTSVRRRTQRGRLLKSSEGEDVLLSLKARGFYEWKSISDSLLDPDEQLVRRFCLITITYALRTLPPVEVFAFPFLLDSLSKEIEDFEMSMVLCPSKQKWSAPFPEEHDLSQEANSYGFIKDLLGDDSYSFLIILEYKLIARCWQLLEMHIDGEELLTEGHIDPSDPTHQSVALRMRSDLIETGSNIDALRWNWWSSTEVATVLHALRNFEYVPSRAIEFHIRTGLVSKTTFSIVLFISYLDSTLAHWRKGPLTLSKVALHSEEAPDEVATSKTAFSWGTLSQSECEFLVQRRSTINIISSALRKGQGLSGVWTNALVKRYLSELLERGLDKRLDILKDKNLPFYGCLEKSDLEKLDGVEDATTSGNAPDFIFGDEQLYKAFASFKEEESRIRFCMPSVGTVKFSGIAEKVHKSASQKKVSEKDEYHTKQRSKNKKKTPLSSPTGDEESDSDFEGY